MQLQMLSGQPDHDLPQHLGLRLAAAGKKCYWSIYHLFICGILYLLNPERHYAEIPEENHE
ncbi:hypothetical protein RQN30_10955 [Arcanobacterium hippocoleae]